MNKYLITVLLLVFGCKTKLYKMEYIKCKDLITTEQSTLFYEVVFDQECELEKLIDLISQQKEDAFNCNLGTDFIKSRYYENIIDKEKGIYTKIWFQKDSIVKIDLVKSINNVGIHKEVIKTLGEPVKKVDYYYDVIHMKEKVWVYPKEGIAFFWGFENTTLNKVCYFKPTNIGFYMQKLHNVNKPREFEY